MVLFAPQRAPETRSVCQTSELKLEENNVRTTYMAKPGEVERKWYVVDATDVPLDVFQQLLHLYYVVKINQLSHLIWILAISSSSSMQTK